MMTVTGVQGVSVADLDRAALQVVGSALQLRAGQRITVISDRDSSNLGDAVVRAARRVGGKVVTIRLEELGARPLGALPRPVVEDLQRSEASVFVASAPREELTFCQHLLHQVTAQRLRHAHLPGISDLAFAAGLRVDYAAVHRHGRRILSVLENGEAITTTSPAGTMLRVYTRQEGRWFAQLGELAPGRWGNLPAGALYATPENVHGVFVADACLGERFGRRAGLLRDAPVRFTIQDGRVAAVETADPELRGQIEMTLGFGPNSDRIGLIALGVNFGIAHPTGEALVDQNLPGLHICIGDPAARVTGATWSARTSFAACQSASSVRVDREHVVRDGEIVIPS